MHPNRRRHAEALGRRPARERDFIPGEGPTCASQQCWSSLGSHNRYLSRMSYVGVFSDGNRIFIVGCLGPSLDQSLDIEPSPSVHPNSEMLTPPSGCRK